MNYLDALIIIPALWFGYQGFTHGLIRELVSLTAIIFGLYAAFVFTDMIEKWINNPAIPKEAYFAITFIIVLIVVFLLGKLAEKIIKLIIPDFVNYLLGGIFGVAKVMIIFSAVIYFINNIDVKHVILKEDAIQKSFTYKYIEPIVPKLKMMYDNYKSVDHEPSKI